MTNSPALPVLRLARLMVVAVAVFSAADAHALIKCEMDFRLEGWSAFYNTAAGSGTITCDDDRTARVTLHTVGGGVTFGKTKIVDGRGEFTSVEDIGELFGDYASAEAHAGAGESATAQVVTKGTVSLTLTGKGQGIDVGFAFGKFSIEPAPKPRVKRPKKDPHDGY